jgi:DEAD/DEAH box helicase domain-containing protein
MNARRSALSRIDAVETTLRMRFAKQIREHRVLPAEEAALCRFRRDWTPVLPPCSASGHRTALFSQTEAFESVAAGRDTVFVSRTASGKTLAFLLPILSDYCRSEAPFGVLLLYPTKALSRDQEGTLGALLKAALGTRTLGTFDGDTPREERAKIMRAPTSSSPPGMLHAASCRITVAAGATFSRA